ncbi:MAG: hypothetical protein KatS3mg131_3241 [Candidatus Tectimicrobiota bacterium]|nr:MAG: hypothetical protein KatS3mg131_3241 [Candidatus Tectomicrobia bacterium]
MPRGTKALITAMVLLSCFAAVAGAEQPFGLPDCAADLAPAAVLNPALLDAMILAAEPQGARPDPELAQLFIVVRYYLARTDGLLVVPRAEAAQPPQLLTASCLPYPEAPAHIRAYLTGLRREQQQALLAYHDLVWPPGTRAGVRLGAMVRIPAGPFKRGSGQTVTLEAFAIDVYEVTNQQYRQFIEAGGYTTREWWSDEGWAWVQKQQRRQPSYWQVEAFNAPEQPVVGVSWYEAAAYCQWAGKQLPTELQWEKACRGTDGRAFPWGNTPLPAAAEATFTAPAAVGSAPQTQSPYGVHDLAGNVLEWTSTREDTLGVVLRGGSGPSASSQVGCGARFVLLPGITANFIGFRCAAPVPSQ